MLYSQKKERANLFFSALKIALPFIILIIFWIEFISNAEQSDIFLLTILTFFYVYYSAYLIYLSLKTTLLDPITNVFNRKKIYELISKNLNKDMKVVMFDIKNYSYITQTYGIENYEKIVNKFIIKLNNFLEKNGYKNVVIGVYNFSYFLMIIDEKDTILAHNLRIFEKKITNYGIENIEIKFEFSVLNLLNFNNLKSVINHLSYDLNNNKEKNLIIYDENINVIIQSINNLKFNFKFQETKNNDKNLKDVVTIIPRLFVENYGMYSKNKISNLLNKYNYEINYYKNMIKSLSDCINYDLDFDYIVEISVMSIRNLEFKNYIFELVNQKIINPKNIIFEFFEDNFYSEKNRFNEIINDYRKMGIRFCLSHFGGDNASYFYLKYLNIDFLIFDIEFLKNLNDKKYLVILENYINMAKSLDIKTIFKFIDKKESFDILINQNIDYLQGFYIKRPQMIENLK